ncbi:MAG: tetratricopeptide repeat protein [Bryobacteraceae bacterium]
MTWRILGFLALAGLPAFADTAAVLPFWNTSSTQPNLDWIGESIAETIREALGSRGALTLERPDIQDAFRSLGLRERVALSQGSVIKVGESLDAEQVVYGNFEFTPDPSFTGPGVRGSLKISARIVDLKRLHLRPEFVESGALSDLAALQAHLAWRALTMLAPNLAPPESEFRSVRTPIRLDAEENYVRGLLARDPVQKEKFFLQAARLDDRFGNPCYQLGQMYYQRKQYREAAGWLQKVGEDDIHYREAGFLLGLADFQSGDFASAQKEFQMIAAVVPLSEVFNDLGAAENRQNLPRAIADFQKAVEGDPNDSVYRFNLGYALWKKGDFAAAAEQFRATLAHAADDQMATLLLGRCLKKQPLETGIHSADARLMALERLKTNYEERAYWQLKAVLDSKSKPGSGSK